jgi:hypothetical protein
MSYPITFRLSIQKNVEWSKVGDDEQCTCNEYYDLGGLCSVHFFHVPFSRLIALKLLVTGLLRAAFFYGLLLFTRQ